MLKKLGVIGYGHMAKAIVKGMKNESIFKDTEFILFDIIRPSKEEEDKPNVKIANTVEELLKECDTVMFGVRPQNAEDLIKTIKNSVREEHMFISILAGISIDFYKSNLGENVKITRVMPNTPAELGMGATAVSFSKNISEDGKTTALSIFKAVGIVEILDEKQMNAVVSVNGSSPAYVYMLADAVAKGAKELGIDEYTALNLFTQTIIGSAHMIQKSGQTPEKLAELVAVPGGTTEAALNVFKSNNFHKIIAESMKVCTERAEELSK